ncbi:hypothetical protein Jiend_26970 [Micromonospora endophytica]|nr:hypothetical protein Jiend_26970 [Micromonospora endophytica]
MRLDDVRGRWSRHRFILPGQLNAAGSDPEDAERARVVTELSAVLRAGLPDPLAEPTAKRVE